MSSAPNWHSLYVPSVAEWVALWAGKADSSEVAAAQSDATKGLRISGNVQNYGAIGDGVTDNTAAIQAAADAIPAVGGVLYFPAGNYLVRASILLKSRTTVRGDGPGSCMVADASWIVPGTYPFLLNQNCAATVLTDHDIDVEDMQFDYGAFGPIGVPGGGKHQVEFRFARNVRISRCTFQTRGAENATALIGCANTLIEACSAYDFINCGYDHWWGPQKGRVIGCYGQTAISSQMVNWNPEATSGSSTGLSADGFVLADNEFVGTGANAIPIQLEPLGSGTTASNIVVTGNVFNNVQLVLRGATRGATIAANSFVAPLGACSAIQTYTQNSGSPTDFIVSDNNILDPTTQAGNLAVIRVWTASAIISGNRISGAGYLSGIDTSSFAAIVVNNSISNGVQNTPAAVTAGAGLHLGSVNAASVTDVTKHMDMWGGVVGLNITTSRLNFVLPTGNSAIFVSNGVDVASVSGTGLNGAVIGATTPAAASVTQLNLTTSAGPNIRSGTGAASGTQPKGSIWVRTDGAAGTTMYVSQGGGTWNAVAGV